jgi:hypothetical protein
VSGKDFYARLRDGKLVPSNLPTDVARAFETVSNFAHGVKALVETDQNELYVSIVQNMASVLNPICAGTKRQL